MKEKEQWIIRRGVEYLVAIAYLDSRTPRWSRSPWDAVRIPWRDEADRVAKKFGADVLRFSNVKGVME